MALGWKGAWLYAAFRGEEIVKRHLERVGRELLYQQINAATWTTDSKALDTVLQTYGAPPPPFCPFPALPLLLDSCRRNRFAHES